jgi:hypothetical protein
MIEWQCPCPACMGTLEPPEPTAEEEEAFFASRCNRLLVGQGDETYDPCCMLDAGHDGPCNKYFGTEARGDETS